MRKAKKVGRSLFRRLPWYGKLLVPFVVLAGMVYVAYELAKIFV
ncbi:hypothetical protein ACTXJG_08300 [Glutamicibacter arilaitensis]